MPVGLAAPQCVPIEEWTRLAHIYARIGAKLVARIVYEGDFIERGKLGTAIMIDNWEDAGGVAVFQVIRVLPSGGRDAVPSLCGYLLPHRVGGDRPAELQTLQWCPQSFSWYMSMPYVARGAQTPCGVPICRKYFDVPFGYLVGYDRETASEAEIVRILQEEYLVMASWHRLPFECMEYSVRHSIVPR
jgi:hypothetical protein